MTILITIDCESVFVDTPEHLRSIEIHEDADIIEFSSFEDAKEYFKNSFSCSDFEIADFIEGEFQEFWVQTHTINDPEKLSDTIDGIRCNVTPPGLHPGGQCYWCVPDDKVYIPLLKYRAE